MAPQRMLYILLVTAVPPTPVKGSSPVSCCWERKALTLWDTCTAACRAPSQQYLLQLYRRWERLSTWYGRRLPVRAVITLHLQSILIERHSCNIYVLSNSLCSFPYTVSVNGCRCRQSIGSTRVLHVSLADQSRRSRKIAAQEVRAHTRQKYCPSIIASGVTVPTLNFSCMFICFRTLPHHNLHQALYISSFIKKQLSQIYKSALHFG